MGAPWGRTYSSTCGEGGGWTVSDGIVGMSQREGRGRGDPPTKADGVDVGAWEVGVPCTRAGSGEGGAGSGLGMQGQTLCPKDISPKCLDGGCLGWIGRVTVWSYFRQTC